MDFSKRIREAITASGKSQATLSRELGISQSAIAQYLSGHVKSMRGNTAALFEQATGYSANWLSTGEGPKMRLSNVEPASNPQRNAVPLISWVQAGGWACAADNFSPGDAEEWIPCPVRHSDSTYALKVRGTSMHNPGSDVSFADGDIIFVDPQREAQHRSLVVARLDDEAETTFKQLLLEGSQKFLQALNPAWPNRIFAIDGNATICGVVIAKLQSFA